jgi:hypothetical protein
MHMAHLGRMALAVAASLAVVAPQQELHAQDPRLAALDSLRVMRLDSVAGVATAYFRPADRERALELRSMLEEYLEFWQPLLGVETRMRIAVLQPDDWKKLTPMPYAFATYLSAPANLIPAPAVPPPAAGLDTLLVQGGRNDRDWLLVGHEGGHLLTWGLMPVPMQDSLMFSAEQISTALRQRYERIQSVPGWYWEFVANHLTTAFLDATRPAGAASWKAYLRATTAVPTPRYTHLDDWFGEFMRARAPDGTPLFLTPEASGNFGWYQGVTGLLAAHVSEDGRPALIAQTRRLVSGDTVLTTAALVDAIEAIAPGARALLDSLGAGYRERPDEAVGTAAVPRFEPGPCPVEPGGLADDATLECGRLVVPESRERPSERAAARHSDSPATLSLEGRR